MNSKSLTERIKINVKNKNLKAELDKFELPIIDKIYSLKDEKLKFKNQSEITKNNDSKRL